jgi:hypothetical protein
MPGGQNGCRVRRTMMKEAAMQQQPETRMGEQTPEEKAECYCPVCGEKHWTEWGSMKNKSMRHGMGPWRMMPMGYVGAMGIAPVLVGFLAGYLIGNANRH